MTLRRIESLEEYCTLLDSDPEEMAALHQDFLIRVTEFFRDPGSFEALRREIFPAHPRGTGRGAADQDLGAWLRDWRRGVLDCRSSSWSSSAVVSWPLRRRSLEQTSARLRSRRRGPEST